MTWCSPSLCPVFAVMSISWMFYWLYWWPVYVDYILRQNSEYTDDLIPNTLYLPQAETLLQVKRPSIITAHSNKKLLWY